MTFRGFRWLVAAALCATAGCASSPADPMGRQNSLEQSQRRYTQLVRWGELERASVFVESELRDGFLAYADDLASIRITDFESGTPDYGEGEATATVKVTYHAYSTHTFLERKIHEKQEWFRDAGLSNTWTVRPQLDEIVQAFR